MAKNNGNGNGNVNGKLNAKIFANHKKYINASFEPNTLTVLENKIHPLQPSICININGNRFEFMINGLRNGKLELTTFMVNPGNQIEISGVKCNQVFDGKTFVITELPDESETSESGDETPDSPNDEIIEFTCMKPGETPNQCNGRKQDWQLCRICTYRGKMTDAYENRINEMMVQTPIYGDSIDITTFETGVCAITQTLEISNMGETITINPPFMNGTGVYANNDKTTFPILPKTPVDYDVHAAKITYESLRYKLVGDMSKSEIARLITAITTIGYPKIFPRVLTFNAEILKMKSFVDFAVLLHNTASKFDMFNDGVI